MEYIGIGRPGSSPYSLKETILPRRALEILAIANSMEITAGKDPMGLAAAALYIACLKYDIKVSQREISIASGVTEVTIRNRYKGLRESLDLTI